MEDLDARLLQFHAHDNRQTAADDARHDGEDQVERADVLMVGGQEPAGEKARRMGMMRIMRMIVICGLTMRVMIVVCGRSSHCRHSRSQLASLAATSTVRGAPSTEAISARFAPFRSEAAAACQALYCCSETTRMAIGMKAWSLPQSSEHWP
ncbi:hypothetical protein D3C78_1012460 [compost metagenome]